MEKPPHARSFPDLKVRLRKRLRPRSSERLKPQGGAPLSLGRTRSGMQNKSPSAASSVHDGRGNMPSQQGRIFTLTQPNHLFRNPAVRRARRTPRRVCPVDGAAIAKADARRRQPGRKAPEASSTDRRATLRDLAAVVARANAEGGKARRERLDECMKTV